MASMLGSDYYTMVSKLLNGYQMDSVLFLQYLNIARIRREMARPWMYLRKVDTSNSVAPVSNNPLVLGTPYTIPSDFLFLSQEGKIILYNNNQSWLTYNEIPLSLYVMYLQVSQNFTFDFANGLFYFMGTIDQPYTAYIPYQANFGDITSTTTWLKIPAVFHPILAFDVACMYRLGQSYDDINARNADKNNQDAETLFASMKQWDDNLQRSSVTNLDYPVIGDTPTFVNKKIDMNIGG